MKNLRSFSTKSINDPCIKNSNSNSFGSKTVFIRIFQNEFSWFTEDDIEFIRDSTDANEIEFYNEILKLKPGEYISNNLGATYIKFK